VSTLAVWLFVLVAIALVAAVVAVVLVARSVYRRSRVLAQNLTGLAADLERTMNTVGQPDGTVRQPKT
jgi:archaellin